MRLRRLATRTVLLGCVALLALGPAVPAAAEEPAPAASPTGSPTVSPVESPAPLPSETPAPAESEPPRTPEQKIEVGLAGEKTPSRVIVELRDEAETAPVAEQAEGLAGSEVVLKPDNDSFIVVEGTGNSLTELAADPRVVSIRRDRAYPPSLASSIKVIGADQAHAAGTTGAGQTIVVMDTGVDRDHPFLAGRVVDEACFSATSEEGLPLESLCPNGQASQTGPGSADAETAKCLDGTVNLCDHGTHVAGIAAGAGVAGAPGPGVAPGANIIAIQIFSRVNDPETCGGTASCLLAFDSTLRLGLDHVATLTGRHKIAAVNLSLGGGLSDVACDTAEEAADLKPKIDALLAQGVATVVAAGNEAFDGSAFPGCISSAVTVGATDDGDAIAPFSNRGPLLDFFAPGVEIDSSVPDDAYTGYSGTSMAAPHVAGALALLKEKFPDAPVTELIDKLRASGRGIVYGNVTTPRIDVNAALTGASPRRR
ncbi:S8 family peptidase [Thermocatellispora tengchongensis]|uniref:S8 family peptidase n=1 Tax=Thermocatellispora tengchongensis TaxID=1073253 RepID=UPI00362EA198